MVMYCPSCGAENPYGLQHCNLCMATFGFENPEYTSPPASDEGYSERYPSSFNEEETPGGHPMTPTAEVPPAAPVETGRYGVTSGAPREPAYAKAPEAPPVDIGAYGAVSGAPQFQGPPGEWMGGRTGAYGAEVPFASRGFNWERAIMTAALAALVAGVASMGLEIILGFVAVSAAFGGHLSLAYFWVLLAMLIPCCGCAYYVGHTAEAYGWALGLISVALWGFLVRPLYAAILQWILSGSFRMASPFSKFVLVFTLCIFLPLGALLGWLGEKRATTGLRI